MVKTITRSHLAIALQNKLGLSKRDSAYLLSEVLEEIIGATVRGESVKLPGFATFYVRDKRLRIGRNPKTSVEVDIEPRRVLCFKASTNLKSIILKKTRV